MDRQAVDKRSRKCHLRHSKKDRCWWAEHRLNSSSVKSICALANYRASNVLSKFASFSLESATLVSLRPASLPALETNRWKTPETGQACDHRKPTEWLKAIAKRLLELAINQTELTIEWIHSYFTTTVVRRIHSHGLAIYHWLRSQCSVRIMIDTTAGELNNACDCM